MKSINKISILLHQKDSPFRRHTYLIWGIMQFWKEMGFRVEVLKGISRSRPQTDLLLPHIDLTKIPVEYSDYINKFPHVLNQRVTDISKRRISSNLLCPTDPYEGPVIVKTDKNSGGLPEIRMSVYSRLRRKLRSLSGRTLSPFANGSSAFALDNYFLFPNLGNVPVEVWSNPDLVVEKFIPERQERYYGIRVCLFMGNIALNCRLLSTSPIIKGVPGFLEQADVPEELLEIREQLGLDYGKFDYVMHQGKVHILDANKTPGVLTSREANASICSKLAKGILSYFEEFK